MPEVHTEIIILRGQRLADHVVPQEVILHLRYTIHDEDETVYDLVRRSVAFPPSRFRGGTREGNIGNQRKVLAGIGFWRRRRISI